MDYNFVIKPCERGYKICVYREINGKLKILGITYCTDISMVYEVLKMINSSNTYFLPDVA